jgi:hypothetical protein
VYLNCVSPAQRCFIEAVRQEDSVAEVGRGLDGLLKILEGWKPLRGRSATGCVGRQAGEGADFRRRHKRDLISSRSGALPRNRERWSQPIGSPIQSKTIALGGRE